MYFILLKKCVVLYIYKANSVNESFLQPPDRLSHYVDPDFIAKNFIACPRGWKAALREAEKTKGGVTVADDEK